MEFASFAHLLAPYARTESISKEDVLFGSGLDLSSIAFLEFIMELEDKTGEDIDAESLDASIRTAGDLHARLFG